MTTEAPYANWLDQYFGQVLADMGIAATSWRLDFLKTWSLWETAGGLNGPSYNPLATTLPASNATNYNSKNVKNYPDIVVGAQATANTILNGIASNPQLYQPIIDTLTNESIAPGTSQAIYNPSDSSWGTQGFANILSQGWSPNESPGVALLMGYHSTPSIPVPLPPNPITNPGGFTDWITRFFFPIPGVRNSPILPIPDLTNLIGKAGSKLNPIQGAASILKALSTILQWIINPHSWMRLGFYLVGGVMIIVGFIAVIKG